MPASSDWAQPRAPAARPLTRTTDVPPGSPSLQAARAVPLPLMPMPGAPRASDDTSTGASNSPPAVRAARVREPFDPRHQGRGPAHRQRRRERARRGQAGRAHAPPVARAGPRRDAHQESVAAPLAPQHDRAPDAIDGHADVLHGAARTHHPRQPPRARRPAPGGGDDRAAVHPRHDAVAAGVEGHPGQAAAAAREHPGGGPARAGAGGQLNARRAGGRAGGRAHERGQGASGGGAGDVWRRVGGAVAGGDPRGGRPGAERRGRGERGDGHARAAEGPEPHPRDASTRVPSRQRATGRRYARFSTGVPTGTRGHSQRMLAL